MSSSGESGLEIEIPSELVDFIEEVTGLPRKTIEKVLWAERQYYMMLVS